jgi:hypothetical protein
MRKKSFKVFCSLLLFTLMLVIVSPKAVQAEDDARIEKLEASVTALQAEIAALKAERAQKAPVAPVVDQKQVEKLVNEALAARKSELGVPEWVSNIKPFGDLRYRHESIDDTDTSADKRNRHRIRARLGLKAKLNDEWDAIFRIATGSSDSPTSTNQTLGDSSSGSFSSKEIWLDMAYADWHPKACDGFNVYMGKMKNPFYRAGKNQLIWDGDVTPEGIAARKIFKLNDSTKAVFTGAGFWLAERSGDADASFWGIQGYLKHKLDNGNSLIGGVTYYDLGNVDGMTPSGVSLNGNTSNGLGGYMYDFDIIEGFAEYNFNFDSMPSALFANCVENTAASSSRNSGYLIGARLNKAKKPGSWQLGYNFRDVQSDAVFAGLTDSDFILGGTGGRGHKFGFKYQLAKNVQGGLTYFLVERDNRTGTGDQDVRLFQADMIFKF